MKMKKLICVMALVCIGKLLVSCGSKRLDNPKAQFIRDFGLNIEKKDCVLEELFNNYEGVPYEGIALYWGGRASGVPAMGTLSLLRKG